MSEPPAPYAWRSVGAVALGLFVLLMSVSGRYGYHRDELYFHAAGRHLAWGYVDQPPLTPLLMRGMSVLVGDSLVGSRILPAVLAVATVLVAALISRELGGARAEQLLTAGATAISAIVLIAGHWLSTTTVDLLIWTVLCWLVIRAVRTGGGPIWLWAGLVAGTGLQNKALVIFLLAALVAGLLLAGPRRVFRDPWLWGAAGLALLIWAPNLIWQASNGWPQLELSAAIAGGSSGSSQPWWLFLPFQLVLVSPGLVPIWVAGLVVLLRSAALRPYRFLGVAYLVLVVVFLLSGGKPYYITGLYPALLAVGALPTVRWVRAGLGRRRPVLLGLAFLVSLPNLVLMLPLLPERLLGPVVAVNYDAGETVGWPRFAETVGTAYDSLPATDRPIVLTRNYGEAAAIERYLPGVPVHSGHNAYWDWGPPPPTARSAVLVGFRRDEVEPWCGELVEVARIDNGFGLENDEQGAPVWTCRSLSQPWNELWPRLRHLG
jgi:4-amino-4-deoxy-L-arabinose transferase-like glycosyltransferase